MKRSAILFLALGGALFLSGCTTPEKHNPLLTKNDDLSFESEKEAAKKEAEAKAAATKAKAEAEAKAKAKNITNKTMYQNAPEMQIDQAKKYTATLHTSEGDIVIGLNAQATPQTVNNFVFLARQNFYSDTIFHRTIKGFMVQGGDPKGDGTGGPGYKFADEKFEGTYSRGTVAMANSGPNTNGSQFFIMHQDNALPPNYVIFGSVTQGIEVVDKIAEAPVSANAYGESSTPVNPVKIVSIEITEE